MKVAQRIKLAVWVFVVVFFFSAPSSVGAQTEGHRGYYVFGHEVRSFQPCGSETIYWVKAAADVSKRLREGHLFIDLEAGTGTMKFSP